MKPKNCTIKKARILQSQKNSFWRFSVHRAFILPTFALLLTIFLSSCGDDAILSSANSSNNLESKAPTLVPPTSSLRSFVASSSYMPKDNSLAVRVTATGDYVSVNAAPLFNKKFGGTTVEDQSCRGSNIFRISEVFDQTRQKYVFSFNMKMGDIDCITKKSDRQRLEVKTYSQSPDNLKGTEGEKHFYSWDIFLPEGFQPSASFTHLFQIKPVGGNDAMPLVTLTARKAEINRLEVLYADTVDARRIAEIPLHQLLGKWINIRVTTYYASKGILEIQIREASNNTQLLHYANNGINMWREGTDFNRPKFGIYRSLNNQQHLREETLLYDEFCISEAENYCW